MCISESVHHFGMTEEDDINPDTDVTYRTVNLFSSDRRFYSTSFLMLYILYKQYETVNTILVKLGMFDVYGTMVMFIL